MKVCRFVIPLLVLFVIAFPIISYAGTFYDDFNNTDISAWLSAPPNPYYGLGNWWVENGVLKQNQLGDWYMLLVNNLQISSQTVQTTEFAYGPSGYDGVTIWFKDSSNYVDVTLYPAIGRVLITEVSNGVGYDGGYDLLTLVNNPIEHKLKVIADSIAGTLQVYVDDAYLFTYDVQTTDRSGLSGLNSGNAGGYFDYFKVDSDDITPVPEPSLPMLLGLGLVAVIGCCWRYSRG